MIYRGLSLSLIFAMSVKLRKSSRLRSHCTLISVPRTTNLSISIALSCSQFIQQPLTPRRHIPPSRLEVLGIPRVGNIAGLLGVVHQEAELAVRVAAADALHIPQIRTVHADQQIAFVVVPLRELPCRMTIAGYLMLRQLALCRRIDRVANLLPAGCCRLDIEL